MFHIVHPLKRYLSSTVPDFPKLYQIDPLFLTGFEDTVRLRLIKTRTNPQFSDPTEMVRLSQQL